MAPTTSENFSNLGSTKKVMLPNFRGDGINGCVVIYSLAKEDQEKEKQRQEELRAQAEKDRKRMKELADLASGDQLTLTSKNLYIIENKNRIKETD